MYLLGGPIEKKIGGRRESPQIVRVVVPTLMMATLTLVANCSITSYGDRRNTYEEVSEYFKAHFVQVYDSQRFLPELQANHLLHVSGSSPER